MTAGEGSAVVSRKIAQAGKKRPETRNCSFFFVVGFFVTVSHVVYPPPCPRVGACLDVVREEGAPGLVREGVVALA